ncbi:MAG: hypothetical protein F6K17_37755 [Okeania sp. SIO3C4]|nr:hypothetical protein [Okeania sp. SIO3C4]
MSGYTGARNVWYGNKECLVREQGMSGTGARCSHCSRNKNNDYAQP